MYDNNTLKPHTRQEENPRIRGFTLVEIMIVIVIILLLTQLGNIGGLFSSREKSKLESVAVQMVGVIDEEKTNALLGKTKNGDIVRKRSLKITLNTADAVKIDTAVNLAKDDESTSVSEKTKTWSLNNLEAQVYGCPGPSLITNATDLTLDFVDDTIRYTIPGVVTIPPTLVLLLTQNANAHEIHMDRRTGLVYERAGLGKGADGEWQISCN